MNNQQNFAEIVLENLLKQVTDLSRDLALVKAELQMARLENESLKRLQQNEEIE